MRTVIHFDAEGYVIDGEGQRMSQRDDDQRLTKKEIFSCLALTAAFCMVMVLLCTLGAWVIVDAS